MTVWSNSNTIDARAVNGDGTLGDVAPKIAAGLGTSLVWDGHRYVLAVLPAPADLLAVPMGGAPLLRAAAPDAERPAAVAPGGNGRLLVTYARLASEAPYGGVWRVFAKGIMPEARAHAVR